MFWQFRWLRIVLRSGSSCPRRWTLKVPVHFSCTRQQQSELGITYRRRLTEIQAERGRHASRWHSAQLFLLVLFLFSLDPHAKTITYTSTWTTLLAQVPEFIQRKPKTQTIENPRPERGPRTMIDAQGVFEVNTSLWGRRKPRVRRSFLHNKALEMSRFLSTTNTRKMASKNVFRHLSVLSTAPRRTTTTTGVE